MTVVYDGLSRHLLAGFSADLLAQVDAGPGGTIPGASGPAPGPITGEPGGAAGPVGGGGGPGGPPPQSLPPWIWLPFILVFVVLIWSSMASQKRERKKKEAMIASLKKHDKVQTIGGIIGSVIEVKPNEVVLKVDEANNIKMRFAPSAIQQVISAGGTTSPSELESSK